MSGAYALGGVNSLFCQTAASSQAEALSGVVVRGYHSEMRGTTSQLP